MFHVKSLGRCCGLIFMGVAGLAAQSISVDTGTGLLHGTLLLPTGKGPFPVALLIAGSGPTDRDGNSAMLQGKNESLKMLAEGLNERGIASVRYDKRGIAESRTAAAKEQDLRFDTYVDDAVSWGQFVRKDKRFGALVIIGHSEGSLIGMIAAQKIGADGFVSLSGPGRAADALLLEQFKTNLPPDLVQQAQAVVKELSAGRTVGSFPPSLAPLFRAGVQPYLISWFRYDPAVEIAKLKVPVLILQGDTDIQVSVADAKLLKAANSGARLVVIDGMNHVLKDVPGDKKQQLASYSNPSLPLSGEVVKEITDMLGRMK